MGGGDLNLKKSWHPNTMKNQERVWKAEQKDNEEKKRIAELQREINAERDKEDMQKFAEDTGVVKKKDDVKLEWMYKGPSHSVNHEDFLLGKAIDKNFEKYQEQQRGGASTSQDEERVPDAIRQAKSSLFSEQVDVARKMNEDPLMAIRQRAVEKAKQLYDNPVRLKQLQKMIASKSADEKKHKKDKKKKKKSKKSSKKEEDKELNALLTEKLKSALKDRELLRKLKKKASKCSDNSSSDSSSNESEEEDTTDHQRKRSPIDVVRKRSHSPKYSKDNRRKDYSSSHYVQRDRRESQSPKPHKSRSFNDTSSSSRRKSRSRSREVDNHKRMGGRRNSRSRSRERQNFNHQRERDQSRYSDMKSVRNTRKSSSPDVRNSKKQYAEKRKNKDRSPSNDNDNRRNNNKGKRSSSSSSSSDHQSDSDDDHRSKKKRSFGLIMADGSRPVPKPSAQKEAKPAVQQTKPCVPTWQRKDRVKLSDEEKERRRQEMLQNASWRDKEREENVKRYRKEEDREKQQLHENFDEDFARKQFSKAANQTSVEGRIKSKLNTIQRSKMSMDQNFARR